MRFIGYLILGALVYVVGFTIHQKHLLPRRQSGDTIRITHPIMFSLLIGCFVVMLIISVLIGRVVMGHEHIDITFVLVNSLVATFVFYFGLNPDTTQMNLPD